MLVFIELHFRCEMWTPVTIFPETGVVAILHMNEVERYAEACATLKPLAQESNFGPADRVANDKR
jgi:hypothetical protein